MLLATDLSAVAAEPTTIPTEHRMAQHAENAVGELSARVLLFRATCKSVSVCAGTVEHLTVRACAGTGYHFLSSPCQQLAVLKALPQLAVKPRLRTYIEDCIH